MSEIHGSFSGHKHIHKRKPGEPTLYSSTFELNLKKETDGNEFTSILTVWIEHLQQWVSQNRYLVAHIKSFIEVNESVNLWISSTGGKVSAKGSDKWQENKFASCKVSMTVIIFGPEKHVLKAKVTEYFNEGLKELI